jgi:xanthine/uracil permease
LLISKVDFVIPAGKFGALFASIPFTVFAAVYCVLFGLVGVYHSSIISFSDGI